MVKLPEILCQESLYCFASIASESSVAKLGVINEPDNSTQTTITFKDNADCFLLFLKEIISLLTNPDH
jgi:hypothetical protein